MNTDPVCMSPESDKDGTFELDSCPGGVAPIKMKHLSGYVTFDLMRCFCAYLLRLLG